MGLLVVVVFFLLGFVLSVFGRANRSFLLSVLLITIFSLLLANRSLNTPDTEVYVMFFQNVNLDFTDFTDFRFEWGFQLLTKFIKVYITSSYRVYLGIIAFLNFFIILLAIRKLNIINLLNNDRIVCGNERYILAVLLYISYFGIYYGGIVLRGGIALSLLIYASVLWCENKKIWRRCKNVILLFLCALSFHITSILALPIFLFFLSTGKYSKQKYFLFLGVVVCCYIFNIREHLSSAFLGLNVLSSVNILNEIDGVAKVNHYLMRTEIGNGYSLKYLFFILLGFYYVYFPFKTTIYYKYFNVYLLGLLLYVLFGGIDFISRGLDYFLIYSFLISYMSLKRQYSNKILFWTMFVLISVCQLVLVMRIINGVL